MIANVNMYICLPKFDFNVGDVANPIIVLVVVIIVVFQFELEYLKNCKSYRYEILHTSRV